LSLIAQALGLWILLPELRDPSARATLLAGRDTAGGMQEGRQPEWPTETHLDQGRIVALVVWTTIGIGVVVCWPSLPAVLWLTFVLVVGVFLFRRLRSRRRAAAYDGQAQAPAPRRPR